MPTQENQMECICCGRPSATVVCMHCFFNYDHRTANNRDLEKAVLSHDEVIFNDNEQYISYWEQEPEPEQEPIRPSEPAPLKERKKTNGGDTPSVSWFSRLPRFS